jgi:DNA excision repair protein ERCC-4
MVAINTAPIILVDSREQKPYKFDCIVPIPTTKIVALKVGDYSIEGYQDEIGIERKSLEDAYNTFGQGRKRFQRELEKSIGFKFFAVIIESDWHSIVKYPPIRSNLNPKSVVSSIAAWSMRYRVHFWTVPNREFGERWTYRLLERFHNDLKTGKIKI